MATVTSEIFVEAPPKAVYRAFTNSTSLREWLCDVATVEPHPRGRFYAWWRGDYYFGGHFLELEENRSLKFRWTPSADPAPTDVTVTMEERDGGVLVQLEHAVPEGESWQSIAQSYRENWEESLENLKSVLETGIDLRIANRPMLGIFPGDFTEDQATALGVPVREGLRLDGVVDSMGAQKAGLQRDDVIVEMAGHPIRSDANSLPTAIVGKKGGDTIEVVLYRGPEKKTIQMELSKRPMPEVPSSPAELAQKVRELIEPALAELDKCFEGYSDEEAMTRPDPKEWSALEIVAHLVQTERFNSTFLTSLIDGYELTTDGFGSNVTAQLEATVKANPSIKLMLDMLRRTVDEVLIYTELISEDFAANKGSYYRFGFNLLQPNFHINAHMDQIKDTLAAARR